ncbi:DgyrCDS9417 [Dimorphilus gyrociliatus]|uniref:DgyrCDS9417 n=1 Tax=Dimorphilus gyrociliatus TaxID=2664684 RepID=A0A7I8VYD5_9ANNE|nr:DgyrCDS9417 [Dimorphilus gyrociliatus]
MGRSLGTTFVVLAIFGVLLSLYFDQNLVSEILSKFSVSLLVVQSPATRVFTIEELSKYDGSENSLGLYLSIMGEVFDVSKGAKFYGPGGGYHFFSGRDASKAFITGKFEDGLTDNVDELSPTDLVALVDWKDFYHKEYKYVGKLDGWFFNSDGQPTENYKMVNEKLEIAKLEKHSDKLDEQMFPPCNSEWSQADGGFVWCSKSSGGIERNWVGVPRRYFRSGKTEPRCACVRTTGPPSDNRASKSNNGDLDNPNLREYQNCDRLSERCRVM